MTARIAHPPGLLFLVLILVGCGPVVERLATPTARPASLEAPSPKTTPQPALLERRWLILEWPTSIREKDSDLIVLTIAMDENGRVTPTVQGVGPTGGATPIDIPDIYATHTIIAISRLDLAGMEAYREDIREPLRPGQPVTFQWSVRANDPGVYRGVVWLRLELVPKNGGPVDEMLLLARPIDVRVVTVLGLPGDVARILGGVGLVASTLLGYPFIQRLVAPLFQRKTQVKPEKTKEE